MHGHVDQAYFLESISGFLGTYYLVLAAMNGVVWYRLWRSHRDPVLFRLPGGFSFTAALIWLLVAVVFTIMGAIAYSSHPQTVALISIPAGIRTMLNNAMDPTVYNVGIVVVLGLMFLFRKFFVKPLVAWTMLNLSLLAMGLAMTDYNFSLIVTKPDNVPIVGMVFLLGFFTWLATYRAVQNDQRFQDGLGPLEAEDNEKILVWPDLVYTELICMVALTALLLFWAIALKAPLEEPASAVKTPNPSKAPWYFLGLQEMLVYYDPWMAGVVLPSLVVFGLMAIPFLDFNKAGNGYYTIDQRKFAYVTFQFGFLVLWVTLIVMGTFLRGPNWNFFGPFEPWDAHKVEALNNVDLSEYFWVWLLGTARPSAPSGSGEGLKILYILYREIVGIVLLVFYLGALPPALVLYSKFFRGLYRKMGFVRYMVMTILLLFMALLPIKMAFRWTINLKYFIAIPEYLTNF